MKLGSLFDGSGGFPLAGTLCGIEPVWAAEVEPYPIAVTSSRFPNVKHLGSVTGIHGGKIEPVDIITFGSPCQDLSVAGKRAGLKHEANGDEETTRSGLLMEAVRIIKEMRESTNGQYPTFAVWENVPGAFSSNQGEDFRIVLEELIKVVEPGAVMPAVPKNGWAYADSYRGDGWSLSYRVFDAQYWGVPQRRRRVYLVADFGGERARKILFEREGLRGHFAESGETRQAAAAYAEGSAGADDRERAVGLDCYNQSLTGDKAKALTNAATDSDHIPCVVCGLDGYNATTTGEVSATLGVNCGMSTGRNGVIEPVVVLASSAVNAEATDGSISPCLMAREGTGGNQLPLVAVKTYDARGNGDGDTVSTLTGDHENRITDYTSVVCEPIPIHDKATRYKGGGPTRNGDGSGNGFGVGAAGDPMNTPTVGDHHAVCYAETYQKVTGPLMANSHPGSYTGQDAYTDMLVVGKENEPIVLDRAFYNQGQNAQYDPQFYTDGTVPTLVARGPSAVAHKATEAVAYVDTTHADDVVRLDDTVAPLQARDYKGGKLVQIRYIVRRLTPTECARLQGFPDKWGHPDHKEDFTDEEWTFWAGVRNTHAAINGKATKSYTREQMVKWYNGLHTDSAEYKMWGNGIALPCARYVMEGIKEVSRGELMA